MDYFCHFCDYTVFHQDIGKELGSVAHLERQGRACEGEKEGLASLAGGGEAGYFCLDFLNRQLKSLRCLNGYFSYTSETLYEAYTGHSAGCPLIYIYIYINQFNLL